MKRNNRTVKLKKTANKPSGSIALFMLVIMLFSYSAILVYNRSVINALDTQIRKLENEYSTACKVNDDLQGRIIEAKNLTQIEDYAVTRLGMIQAKNTYISYVSYTPKAVEIQTASGDTQLISWLKGLFR
ncbi:MAG: hypothetical protein GX061_05100 [Eubacteriaceae bacterium]|jgi:cell division protein FtsL|nr:hypothetical protein [Eubacteriaceae bacterium]